MKSKIYKIISILIAVIGFIGGIVAGNIFKIAETKDALFSYTTYKFNTSLMIGVWIGTILVVLIFIGIFFILKNQENILAAINTPEEKSEIESSQPLIENREPNE